MTKRPQAVLVDRLSAALALHGVKLQRSQILEVASAAFGYHNSHEFIAAAKRGTLTPDIAKPVTILETQDAELMVLRDPSTNALYALEVSFLEQVAAEERRETFGPSPYGGLVSLESALEYAAEAADAVPSAQGRQAGQDQQANDEARVRIAELEELVAWLELRLSNAKVFQPDWRSWDRDLKKASVRDASPIDDETLGRLRHALADVHCKSSASERLTVEYRSARFAEKVMRRLLARLDQVEARLSNERTRDPSLRGEAPADPAIPIKGYRQLATVMAQLAEEGHAARFALADAIEMMPPPVIAEATNPA